MGLQGLMQLLKEQDPFTLPVSTSLAWLLYLWVFAF